MRWLITLLLIMFVTLQFRLWQGEGSYVHLWTLREEVREQERENQRLRLRNQVIANEVIELQRGLDTVEEVARQKLGLIRTDETFYLITEPQDARR